MTLSPLLLTYYGDDLTGSTDAMEVLEWGGVKTALFLEPPTPALIDEHFPDVQAVGVAGVSRSLTPAEMDSVLPDAFAALAALETHAIHYKVCSTFDSSPTVGSIGHAIDIASKILGEQIVPVVVGAPALGRYVAFSNLFARAGDVIYRIDRHPTMNRHPVTPMTEGNLCAHLAQQTQRQIAPIDLLQLGAPPEQVSAKLEQLRRNGVEIALFDTVDDRQLLIIGGVLQTLFTQHNRQAHQFVVGSSSVESALIAHWQANGVISRPPPPPSAGAADQIIVMSGSAAPGNAEQIAWAQANGWATLRLNAAQLVDPDAADQARSQAVTAALGELDVSRNLVLFSALGPNDPALLATKARLAALGIDPHAVSRILGKQQGLILRDLLERSAVRRVVVAGGDTCGYAARQLGIYALRAIAPIAPGAPLCRAYASPPQFDGLHIALKGGQIGDPNYFDQIRRGCR